MINCFGCKWCIPIMSSFRNNKSIKESEFQEGRRLNAI